VDVERLRVVKTKRGEYIAVTTEEKGELTEKLLQQLLPQVIQALQFPKMMRWGSGTLRFVRPICWILALYGTSTIRFELDGLLSDNVSFGHRFLSSGPIRVENPSDYVSLMSDNHVVPDIKERRDIILSGIKEIESRHHCNVTRDEELLDTVNSLVEYPTVILGEFGSEYLNLPKELPITVMKIHQKYFSVEDSNGSLLPYFIVISNTSADNSGIVRKGAERVLRARLEDARFYFNEDQKIPLWDYVERLKKVTFQEKLGSLYEKIERITFICSFIADSMNYDGTDNLMRAAMLSKADLVTGIVREFPELQGYMGMVYAINSGETGEVATGIHEHYFPRFAGDRLPDSDIGIIISLADKMDNISSFFFLGLIPTGSEDPFALRRQATGIINILLEKDYPFALDALIERSLQGLESYSPSIKALKENIIRFFLQRFEGMQLSQGYSHDLISAVLSTGELDMRSVHRKIASLSRLKSRPEFPGLLIAAKRVYNILAEKKSPALQTSLLHEEVEKELLRVTRSAGETLDSSEYESLFSLEKPINSFFDTVLVMDERPEIRNNRFALLTEVKRVFQELADFSKIQG
jgi:glycyl-tRNA synthetase beta chain